MKNKTRFDKSVKIFKNAKHTQWCRVDIHNVFQYNSKRYIIGEDVEDYKVHNKAGEVEDYTNEAYMEEILAVLDVHNNLSFYSQKYDLVEDVEEYKI